jgi:hypothetical protein
VSGMDLLDPGQGKVGGAIFNTAVKLEVAEM